MLTVTHKLIAPRVHTPKLASRRYNVVVSFLIPRGLPQGSSFQGGNYVRKKIFKVYSVYFPSFVFKLKTLG